MLASLAAAALLQTLAPAALARLPEKAGPAEKPGELLIYGSDDRLDVRDLPAGDRRRELAKSVVAVIPLSAVTKARYGAAVDQTSLGDYYGLKPSERFRGQPAAASCSGTLVGEKVVLTAAHCFKTDADCKNYLFAFDYMYDAEDRDLRVLPKDSVYWCVPCEREPAQVLRLMEGWADWMLVCLDRAPGRAPIPPDFGARLRAGEPVYALGFPSGLPLKVSGGARIQDARQADEGNIIADVDIFGGNSGGPVFLAETHQFIGIVRADRDLPDYVDSPGGKGKEANVVEDPSFHDLVRIHPVRSKALRESLEAFGLGTP